MIAIANRFAIPRRREKLKSDQKDKNTGITKPVESLKALEALSLYEAQLV